VFLWYVGGAVILAAAVVGLRQLRRRPDADRELTELVLSALATEWARRFTVDVPALRDALVDGSHPALRERIEDAVGVVDITFTRRPAGSRRVGVEVRCGCPQDAARTTVTLEIDATRVPDDVRAEFQADGQTTVVRRWSAGGRPSFAGGQDEVTR
jgi:hypothetical protein